MERLLIVNADDFGLSKGQNYGIIEACRNGIVTSTTALVIYRLICAVHTDSVARFMVKRLARHCSCKCLMIPAIAGNARWKSCAIRHLSII